MAGAILGAISNEPPRGAVLDEEYVVFEASRMNRINRKEDVETFVYPDLFAWHPPKTQLDAVGRIDAGLALAGLAKAREIGPPLESRKKEDAVWQWLRLEFGQSCLCKATRNTKCVSRRERASSLHNRHKGGIFNLPSHPQRSELKVSPEQRNLS